MITYTKGLNTSYDFETNAGGFAPIIRVLKDFEYIPDFPVPPIDPEVEYNYSADDELKLVRSKVKLTGIHPSFAIFENTTKAEIIESSPGYSGGGVIVVTPRYVGVGYAANADTFKIIKSHEGVEMKPSFTQISPLSYISSDAASRMNTAPVAYLPTKEGYYEQYAADFCPNIPSCGSAFVSNGRLLGAYGITTGTLSLNFFPTNKTGIAKNLLRNQLYASETTTLPANEGIGFSSAIRASAQKLVTAIRSGARVSMPNWSKRTIRPASISKRFAADFDVLQLVDADVYEAATAFAFLPAAGNVGIGLNLFVSKPSIDTAHYCIGSNRIAMWLAEYKQNVEKFRKEGLKALVTGLLRLIEGITTQVNSFDPRLKVTLGDKDGKYFPAGDTYTYTITNLPAPFKKVYITADPLEIATADADRLREIFLQQAQVASQVAETVDYEEQTIKIGDSSLKVSMPKFSLEKFDTICEAYLDKLKKSVEDTFTSVIDALSTQTASVGQFNHVFAQSSPGGCGSAGTTTTRQCKAYPGSDGAVATQNFLAFSQNKSSYGARTAAFNRLLNVGVENFKMRDDGNCDYVGFIDFEFLPMVTTSYLTSLDTVYTYVCQALKYAFGRSGIDCWVEGRGWSRSNPLGFGLKSIKQTILGTKTEGRVCTPSESAIADLTEDGIINYLQPVPTMQVRVHFNSRFLAMNLNNTQAVEFVDTCVNNLESSEERAVYLAMRILVDRLESDGMLSKCLFTGSFAGTSVTLYDMCQLSDYKNTETLVFLFEILSKMQARSGEFAAITEAERNLISANLTEFKKALLASGYNISYDYETNKVNLVKAQTGSVIHPWIMDLSGFNPNLGDTDFNLIPLYTYYA